MIITDFLERNARLYGGECALVELSPSEERDKAVTWWDFNLIESASVTKVLEAVTEAVWRM